MSEDIKIRRPLPACNFDRDFINKLWDNFAQDGEFTWQANVGLGGDLLGKQENRPEEIVNDLEELISMLESLPRIDSLKIIADIPNRGVISILFKNFTPAGGILAITSFTKEWGEAKSESLKELFTEVKEDFSSKLYSRLGFGVIQTLIPLTLSFIIVMAVAALIPSEIRHSPWLGWITAITLVCTLRLAYTISDRMIIYVLKNYPYIRWLS